jgi:two-component system sensor histidine kinase DesK
MKRRATWLAQGYRRWKDLLVGLEGAEESIASSGISFQLWRLYQHFWLLCLVFPIVSLVQAPPSTVRLGLALAGLAGYVVGYTWLMWPHPASHGARERAQSWRSRLLLLGLLVLVLLLSLSEGRAFLWLFIGVSACAGILLPLRAALLAIILLIALPVVISLSTAGGVQAVDWLYLLPLLLLIRGLGLDMLGGVRLFGVIRELQAARRDLARLAVAEERLRLARDLHDLLGRHLSMIALKSELAERLVEGDPLQARHEMREVEQVARQTLREVREAVAGYRHPTLQSELESAQQLLEAAGIEHQLELAALKLPPVLDAVLAWVVREGVTNVVRHSRARRCRIQVTHVERWVRIEVTNDDRKLSQQGPTPLTKPASGSGLVSLAERVAAQGGHLEADPWLSDGITGFRLLVELPVPPPEQQSNRAVLIKTDQADPEGATP